MATASSSDSALPTYWSGSGGAEPVGPAGGAVTCGAGGIAGGGGVAGGGAAGGVGGVGGGAVTAGGVVVGGAVVWAWASSTRVSASATTPKAVLIKSPSIRRPLLADRLLAREYHEASRRLVCVQGGDSAPRDGGPRHGGWPVS